MLRRPLHLRAEYRTLALLLCIAAGLSVWHTRAAAAGHRAWPEAAARRLLGPLQFAFSQVAVAVGDAVSSVARAGALARENRELRAEVARLQTEKTSLHEYFKRYKAITEQLGLDDEPELDECPAVVVGHSPHNWVRRIEITVSKGRQIAPGDVVLADGALVGHVTRTDNDGRRGTVQLLLDKDHFVAGMIQRSRNWGMIQGPEPAAPDQNVLRMGNLSREADVRVHDWVITCGRGGIYPKGLLIGEVARIDPCLPSDVSQSATIRPSADFDRLEYVLVLRR